MVPLNVRYLQRRKLLKVHDRIIYTQEKETVQNEDSCNMENGKRWSLCWVIQKDIFSILALIVFFCHQICSNLITPCSQVAWTFLSDFFSHRSLLIGFFFFFWADEEQEMEMLLECYLQRYLTTYPVDSSSTSISPTTREVHMSLEVPHNWK